MNKEEFIECPNCGAGNIVIPSRNLKRKCISCFEVIKEVIKDE